MNEPPKDEPVGKVLKDGCGTLLFYGVAFFIFFGVPILIASQCSGPGVDDPNEWRVREIDNPGR